MPREYGRVEHVRRTDRWRVIAYRGKGESKIGEYDTRQEAVNVLQADIRKRKGTR